MDTFHTRYMDAFYQKRWTLWFLVEVKDCLRSQMEILKLLVNTICQGRNDGHCFIFILWIHHVESKNPTILVEDKGHIRS